MKKMIQMMKLNSCFLFFGGGVDGFSGAEACLAFVGKVRANKAAVTQPGLPHTALVNTQIC